MERSDVFDAMKKLKLYGMRAAQVNSQASSAT